MSHGIYQLQPDVNHLSQLSVVTMPAMSNRVGGVMQGAGVSIDTTGLLTLAPATSNVLGGVKIGSGVNVGADGTISVTPSSNYVLPPATASVLGGVKIGSGITVQADGTISATGSGYTLPVATPTVLGGVKVGTNIAVAGDGTISLPTTISGAITFSGVVTASSNLNVTGPSYLNGGMSTSSAIIGPPGSGDALQVKGADGYVFTTGSSASNGGAYFWTSAPKYTIYGPVTNTGLITAGAGVQINAGQSEAYLDTGNAFQLFRVINSGNNILLQYQPSAGAGWSNQVVYYVGTSKGTVSFPDAAGVSIAGPVATGNLTVNGTQVWGGAVNANTQNLSNVNNLSVAARISTNGNSSDIVQFNTGGTKYLQFIAADGSQGANPYIFSSTGILVTNAGLNLPYATFTNPGAINFGSNFVAWNPTINANAGTITVTGWYNCFWCRVGPMGYLTMRVQFNITGTAPNWIYVYLPVAAVNPNNYAYLGAATIETGGGVTAAWAHARIENTDHILIQQQNNATFPIGTGYMLSFSGWYRIV